MARHRHGSTFLVALALLSLAPAARAADASWPVAWGPSREPAPYRYDAAVWKTVPREFLDDAPACTLYTGATYLIEPDGTVETITHEITRLNSRKAVEKLGEYKSIIYTPPYQKLTLHEARIHKADGRTVPVQPGHVQLRDLATDYQVYDHDKQLILSLPTLEAGDVFEVKWSIRGRNPEHQGQFFTRYTFGDDSYPVVREELRVRVPKGKALKHAATGGRLEPTVADAADTRTYLWAASNRRQLPQDSELPSKEELRLMVSASTFTSWDEVARWKQALNRDCWKCTDELRAVVKNATRGLTTPEEKARALTYWLRRNIRYVSAGEKHDYTPHTPAATLANRYGDCKDSSQLLAVLFREAAIPVAQATLGVVDDGQVLDDVPSPWGTHAILLATIDGKPHWIDTTLSLGAWDYLPRDDRDRVCYVTDDRGIRLVRTPCMRPDDNVTEQTTRVRIAADGTSHCERTATYRGAAALAQRDAWMEVPAGERRRVAAAELQEANAKARFGSLQVDEARLRDLDGPVMAKLVFDIPGQFAGETEREGSLTDSKVWAKLLSVTLDYDREAALDLWAPFESRHRMVFHIPPGWRVETAPRDRKVESKWGTFTLTVKKGGDRHEVDVELHTRLEATRVEPAEFAAFRRFQEDVGKYYRVWLSLRPAESLDDAKALEKIVAQHPDDLAAAQTLARMYLDHGKPEAARRVLGRARSHHPKDAKLWELTVKAAADLAEEEAAYREMVRLFPDEPSYGVALGAVLVDRGKAADARAVLEPLTRQDSGAVRSLAHFHMARGWLGEGRADKARADWEAAEKADADSVKTPDGLLFKGELYEKLAKLEQAAEAYRRLAAMDDQADKGLLGLARLELAKGEKAEAIEHLRRYVVAVGDDALGLLTAADYYLRLGRLDDASDLATRADGPRFHEPAHRVLGLVCRQRGDNAGAVSHLTKANPDAAVLEALIRSHLALGQLKPALQRAEQGDRLADATAGLRQAVIMANSLGQRRRDVLAAAKVPAGKEDAWADAAARFVCAEYAWRDGRPAGDVEALLEPVLAEGAALGPVHGLRGLLALERGKLTKALADADRAIALSPQEALGYLVRGRVRLERVADGALADLTKAVELSGRRNATALHWLAAAQLRAGDRAAALATQREAVKLRPADRELQEQLKELEGTGKSAAGG
jgi:tetratricopeptide (TPR) repeat protein/transglutaminase-like putative cysteine protease